MNITYKNFYDLELEEVDIFFEFLKDASKQLDSPSTKNMYDDSWRTLSNTLPYILNRTTRFYGDSGSFQILYDGTTVVACGGVYRSSFDHTIIIGGVRTYIAVPYRHKSILREYLLPIHKQWAIEHDGNLIGLSFNDYNKNIREIFKRRRLGETVDRSVREPHHLFYTGLHEVEYPLKIQKTKQYVIYEKLKDYDYDWKKIKWR
jgi:hypothetical protein